MAISLSLKAMYKNMAKLFTMTLFSVGNNKQVCFISVSVPLSLQTKKIIIHKSIVNDDTIYHDGLHSFSRALMKI